MRGLIVEQREYGKKEREGYKGSGKGPHMDSVHFRVLGRQGEEGADRVTSTTRLARGTAMLCPGISF